MAALVNIALKALIVVGATCAAVLIVDGTRKLVKEGTAEECLAAGLKLATVVAAGQLGPVQQICA